MILETQLKAIETIVSHPDDNDYKVLLCSTGLFNRLKKTERIGDFPIIILNNLNFLSYTCAPDKRYRSIDIFADKKIYVVDSARQENQPEFICQAKRWYFNTRDNTRARIAFLKKHYEYGGFSDMLKLSVYKADLTQKQVLERILR